MFSQASHNSRVRAIEPRPGDAGLLAGVESLIADLQPDDADLLKGLHRIQHEYGYIPREAIPVIAQRFNTSPALIFGTIDYYSELRTAPPGRKVVEWCSGPACLLKRSVGIGRAIEAVLGCRIGGVTEDGEVELRLVQCDGTCHLAPLIRHDGRYIGPLTASEAIRFAQELRGDAATDREPPDQGQESTEGEAG